MRLAPVSSEAGGPRQRATCSGALLQEPQRLSGRGDQLRLSASYHRSGSSEPFTFHRTKRVAPIWGAIAFMTATCGGAATNACRAAASSHTDSVQNCLAATCARKE